MNDDAREMPKYKCHKEVWALKIKAIEKNRVVGEFRYEDETVLFFEDEGFASMTVPAEWAERFNPQVGMYLVVYKDGYKSISPAKEFEEGYKRIN